MQFAQESLRRARELQEKLSKVRASKTIEDTSPPPGNALLADRSFNERDLTSNPRQKKVDVSVEWADNSKSPLTQAQKLDLSFQTQNNQQPQQIPDKLAKMRERVKRERSVQNYYRNASREDSLYGRKRATYQIDQLRKSAKSTFLAKTNFKEDLEYASQNQNVKRLDASYERRKAKVLASSPNKENALSKSMNSTGMFKRKEEPNRFKRTQKSLQALTQYQAKYDKLEQNFKKFSHSLKAHDQTESLIDELRLKNGLQIVQNLMLTGDYRDLRRGFKLWRLNSGVAFKSQIQQEKAVVMLRALKKMAICCASQNKIEMYQRWKRFALNTEGGNSRERFRAVLSELLTDSTIFNSCIENDFSLTQEIRRKVNQLLPSLIVQEVLFKTGHQSYKTFVDNEEVVVGRALDGQGSLLGQVEEGSIVYVDDMRNDQRVGEADHPVDSAQLKLMNQQEENCFNKVSNLGVVIVGLKDLTLRLYFKANSMTVYRQRQINTFAQLLPDYLDRIYQVRNQINSLASANLDQQETIENLQLLEEFNDRLVHLQKRLDTESEWQLALEDEVNETLASHGFRFKLTQIKRQDGQLVFQRAQIDNLKNQNHYQQNQELFEDFIDTRREFFTHQVSICPKGEEFSPFTAVIQYSESYDQVQQRLEKRQQQVLVIYFQKLLAMIQQLSQVKIKLEPQINEMSAQLELEKVFNKLSVRFNDVMNNSLDDQVTVKSIVELLKEAVTSVFGVTSMQAYVSSVVLSQRANSKDMLSVISDSEIDNYETLVKQFLQKFGDTNKDLNAIEKLGDEFYVTLNQQAFRNDFGQIASQVFLPIFFKDQLLTVFAFNEKVQVEQAIVMRFSEHLSKLLKDFSQGRATYLNLVGEKNRLLERIKSSETNQEIKNLISEHLLMPFLRNQSLKCLGDGLDNLASQLLVTEYGAQDISQIAYFDHNQTFVEDVRLLQTYDGSFRHQAEQQIDKLMANAFKRQQQIVFEDDSLQKVVLLYPIVAVDQFRAGVSNLSKQSGLVLRFNLEKSDSVNKSLQLIHEKFLVLIQPLVSELLKSGQVMMRQKLALSKICTGIDGMRLQYYREVMTFIRDLKMKNVYNFTRSRLYDNIKKSRRYQMVKSSIRDSEYFDETQQKLHENQKITQLIRDALKTMNSAAFKYKSVYFKKFIVGTRHDIYPEMPKRKKRGTVALQTLYRHLNLRFAFSRYAINVNQFKNLTHPRTKMVSAVLCLQRRFRVVKQRLAFLKMKKNLNLFLRREAAGADQTDKDLFIQLNQILLSSYGQQGGLEGAFQYCLGEIFSYLREQSVKELEIPSYGRYDNGFTGHIDEIIISLKPQIFVSAGQPEGVAPNMGKEQSKSRIYVCQFKQSLARKTALKVQELNNSHLSQREQIMSQIDHHNANLIADEEFYGDAAEVINMKEQYSKFIITSKRDLINQMLVKSKGIIFNFQNIQMSLADIFMSHQSNHRDSSIGNRFATVKRSKSALIIPLFTVNGDQSIIGSIELYRHHQMIFSEEMEQRYDFFSKRLADFVILYGQLRAQAFHIEQLKWQVIKAVKPANNLSQLLKSVYLNGPGNHFQNANHVMPIIILDSVTRVFDREMASQLAAQQDNSHSFSIVGEGISSDRPQFGLTGLVSLDYASCYKWIEQKLAFFFQFKDNHIYNFAYEGTFIEEIIDNKCILEMQQKNAMLPDEGPASLTNPAGQIEIGLQHDISTMSSRSNAFDGNSSRRQRSIKSQLDKVTSIGGELFKHIIYYPVFDVQDESRMVAVMEVGYKKSAPANLLTEDSQSYLDQFRSHLDQFKVRLSTFCKSLTAVVDNRGSKRIVTLLKRWQARATNQRYQEQLETQQYDNMRNQELQYEEYVKQLNNFEQQLQTAEQLKDQMESRLIQFESEKKAKLKFLATSLFSTSNLYKRIKRDKLKQAFLKWQYNVSIRKIAEVAFGRVLELNHKHSKARFKAAVHLLNGLVDTGSLQVGFKAILKAAHMRGKNIEGSSAFLARRNTFNDSMSNIVPMLSPANMKKIEVKNLYQKQLNSFYAPQSSNGGAANSINTSALNGSKGVVQMKEFTKLAPLIQLQADDVVKTIESERLGKIMGTDMQRGHGATTNDNTSRYHTNNQRICAQSYTSHNSFKPSTLLESGKNKEVRKRDQGKAHERNLSMTQIEKVNKKRDYSPIVTTSKHDLKKIYDPQESRGHRSASSGHQRKTQTILSNMATTKGELQRQLYLKQKQLNLIKAKLDANDRLRSESDERPVKQRNKSKSESKHIMVNKVQLKDPKRLSTQMDRAYVSRGRIPLKSDLAGENFASNYGKSLQSLSPPTRLTPYNDN